MWRTLLTKYQLMGFGMWLVELLQLLTLGQIVNISNTPNTRSFHHINACHGKPSTIMANPAASLFITFSGSACDLSMRSCEHPNPSQYWILLMRWSEQAWPLVYLKHNFASRYQPQVNFQLLIILLQIINNFFCKEFTSHCWSTMMTYDYLIISLSLSNKHHD